MKALLSETKFKFFLITLFLCFSNLNYSNNLGNCNFNTSQYSNELKDLNQIKSINIKVTNYRKWTRNILNAFVARESSILPEYKKRFSANVISTYSFGECFHKAKIRLHGDWKDHINFEQGGKLNQSIDVMLEEGSIANIVKFKLLLPETRHHENEIIITKILRLSNFLSPRTSLINVKINETESNMLFQEKASKELLESMNRREGPLFEGDERFLFNNYNVQTSDTSHLDLENVSLSKITNDNWASRNHINALIAIDSFSDLQKAYIQYGRDHNDDYVLDWYILSNGNSRLIENWAIYEMLLFAANSFHALRPHNRKFYYNSFDLGFEPVYFDGDAREIKSRWLRLMPEFSKYPYLQSFHFEKLSNIISSINPELLANSLEGNQFSLSSNEAKEIIDNTLNRISRIHREFKKHKQQISGSSITENRVNTFNSQFIENINSTLPNSHLVNILKKQTRDNIDFFPSKICTTRNGECIKYSLGIHEVGELLERKYLKNLDIKTTLFVLPSDQEIPQPFEYSFFNEKIKVRASENTLVEFDEINLELSFLLPESSSWALITRSDLTNIRIEIRSTMKSDNSFVPTIRINEYGLTGCLTIHESVFEQTTIHASSTNLHCEDVLNIINSEGRINSIKVLRSKADALDIDFSDLRIGSIEISDAGNDCLDFSKGNYFIKNVNVNSCTDKGISVGEDSKFNGKKITINETNIGISSKDSSEVDIENLEISNSNICAEAFQKKQEFFGATLNINNIICDRGELKIDNNSVIKVL